jgi:putative hydrolase of the HAD superfamily
MVPETMNFESGLNGIRGIVFDAVGTLIKPVPSVAEAYTAAAGRQGVVINPAEARRRFQHHFQHEAEHAGNGLFSTDEGTERRRWRAIVRGVLAEVPDPNRAFEELWDHFSQPASWRCYPDVEPALGGLADAGISVCVGSNFDSRLRGVAQGLSELESHLDALVISSEVGYRKPHPDFFRAVCIHLGLPAQQVLCVGDDGENDVRGAIRAGLSGILIDRAGNRPVDLPHVPVLTALVEMRFVQKRPNSRLQSR